MPRNASKSVVKAGTAKPGGKPLSADTSEDATGGVIAVTRALALMEAFELNETSLTLAELSRRVGMHKTTVLRLARTLSQNGYMVQRDDGQWRLGPATGWLGARYQAGFDVNNVVEPTLRELVRLTGESASFYAREGDSRACIARVEGPQSVRHHVRIGERLPLDKGAPGKIILAFSGQPGKEYEAIRQRGFHVSMGEREPEVSSVAAPIFNTGWRLLGSVAVSGPSARLSARKLAAHAKIVVSAANQLSYALAGSRTDNAPAVLSTWHP